MDLRDDVDTGETERHGALFYLPIPDASPVKNEQEKLSGVVKNVHRKLRRKYREVGDFDKIWREHCEDEQTLSEYAVAMKNLADNHWAVNCEKEGRIDWCHSVCQEYFRDGGMKRMLEKDEKSASFSAGLTEASASGRPSSSIQRPGAHMGKIRLLDVGSCFNPFKKFDEFLTVGIDIVPAVELQRPLQLTGDAVEAFLRHLHNPIDALPGQLFHVVVFSLLLSYFPSPYQRWICCKKAHELLDLHGLLLIITPDSSHQNRHALMMRSWRVAVESLGFKRYKTSTPARRTRAARRRPAPTLRTTSWLGPSPSCPTPATRIPGRARAARCLASRSWRTPSCSRPRPAPPPARLFSLLSPFYCCAAKRKPAAFSSPSLSSRRLAQCEREDVYTLFFSEHSRSTYILIDRQTFSKSWKVSAPHLSTLPAF
ncbi:S-adenosylmethionine sensor upstream of mTORC1 isoform X2 [Hippocampus comes]|uniref:S-adenosylmethionine sensor upstream of mTORC1 isoform X2 n=1 Tax=Hippocampus comes TaxID=109280 RepID=UPI00094F01BB|nr:PREDICTED: probable methyltransferase BMT2 homolog isoform X2 [Hippocampus comes]